MLREKVPLWRVARPLVTVHFAQSLDGKIGLGPKSERAILSSEEGVVCAHQARSAHDAVLVGIETVLHDDPQLTVRGVQPAQPLRVVLDSELRLPLGSRLLAPAAGAGKVVVFGCAERASPGRRRELEGAGAEVLLTSAERSGRVALLEALELLAARGVKRLLVEGGAKVLTSFLEAGLAQRAEIEIAPLWLGAPATPSLGELGVGHLGRALRLERIEVERLGQSVLLRGDIVYPARGAE
jgi:riboflavin-specific deaminase-like protein